MVATRAIPLSADSLCFAKGSNIANAAVISVLDPSAINNIVTPPPFMFIHSLPKLSLIPLLEMHLPTVPWPRKIVHDTAYIFIPFAFAVFLLLLGGALLVTWGRLSNAVLVGFCVTDGILIGFFVICHLALYCTSPKEKLGNQDNKEVSGLSPHGSVLDAVSVKLGSPRVCRSCLGGLSVRVPAVATSGGAMGMGRLEPVAGETPGADEAVGTSKDEQLPHQTGLAAGNEPQDRHSAPSPSVRQIQQERQDRTEDELHLSFSQPMSHLSAMIPPLNLGQRRGNSASGFYAFQNPASPRPDSRGGPGILIQPLTEHVARPDLVTNSAPSPAVVNNAPLRDSAPSQPQTHTRTYVRSRLTTPEPSRNTRDRNPPPLTPPPRTGFIAHQRAQQTAPKIGSPLRQSHQYIPYCPRDVGPRSSSQIRQSDRRDSEQLPHDPIRNTTQRRADVGPTTLARDRRAIPDHQEDAQGPMKEAELPSFETHLVRFHEPDMARLIAGDVIKVIPESHPPELVCAPGLSSSKADIEIFENPERRMVEMRRSVDSIRRNRSRKAEVEKAGCVGERRYFSNDSGYCTASSRLVSTNLFGPMIENQDEGTPQCEQAVLPPSWGWESSESSEGERRRLRRQNSVPELCSRFRMGREGREDEHEADDEGSQNSSRD
ncbi:hypothetical protein N0V93_006285 [Gnomoniopsis smithogilvyi]|uniref:Uncharacterized protein n=1 Tax=Gnomoniopsis smithogilvyi TaxID=1191159 RepID=A0A9W8YPJ5_9PEZI|nr:hypothetical protein N0V93_006285 [Gnomoniopsis smithogilvyi]